MAFCLTGLFPVQPLEKHLHVAEVFVFICVYSVCFC